MSNRTPTSRLQALCENCSLPRPARKCTRSEEDYLAHLSPCLPMSVLFPPQGYVLLILGCIADLEVMAVAWVSCETGFCHDRVDASPGSLVGTESISRLSGFQLQRARKWWCVTSSGNDVSCFCLYISWFAFPTNSLSPGFPTSRDFSTLSLAIELWGFSND